MKLGNLTLLLILGLCAPILLYAQPAASPGTGFQWVKTSSASYIDDGATTPESPSVTTFGEAFDTDPTDCSSYCSGNCDGDALLEKLVFGGTSLPASSCEQRAINLVHWNNSNPESGVSAGANSGTVHLATAAQVEIVSSGTKITGSDNKGFIIGGNGPGNNSEFNTQVDYSLNWHVADYSLTGGTGTQMQQFAWNWGEPGGGTQVEMSGWNGYSTAAFETSDGEVLIVPLGSLIESGGNMEIVFEGNMEMFVSRNYGNADGKVQTVPSMEGEVIYTVNYDVWEIQAILPVELSSFNGVYNNGKIDLYWTTESELNNDRFLIEKADDTYREWNVIGEVKSNGDSYSSIDYSFVDNEPSNGQNYYRLSQLDRDGSESISDIIEVTRQSKEAAFAIYPNPVGDQLRLSSETIKTGTIVIIDQNGIVVYNSALKQNIDTQDLPSGLYAAKVLDENGTIRWSQRFVKL